MNIFSHSTGSPCYKPIIRRHSANLTVQLVLFLLSPSLTPTINLQFQPIHRLQTTPCSAARGWLMTRLWFNPEAWAISFKVERHSGKSWACNMGARFLELIRGNPGPGFAHEAQITLEVMIPALIFFAHNVDHQQQTSI